MKFTIPYFLAAAALLMGAGRVQTRDGKTLDGEVTFADNAVVVRAAAETRVPFDNVAQAATVVEPAPTIITAPAGAALPAGWKSQDIGGVKIPGGAACDAKGAFTLTASGWGAWGAKDSLHFAYTNMKGDGQVIARVAKLDQASGSIVAGVMIRQSLAPDSLMAGACLYGSGEVRLPRRPGGNARDFKPSEEVAPVAGVRLSRRGETLAAFRSADGKYWQQVDSHKIPMSEDVLVGVAAWTTGNAWSASAAIDSVTIIPGPPALTYFPGSDPLTQGILLRNGNAIPATIVSFDPAAGVKYERDGVDGVYPIQQVARLIFSRVPPDMAAPSDKPGILLSNGDFIDGDVTAVKLAPVDWPRPPQLKATVRSVLFASRSIEVAREVVAIDFASLTPAQAAYEIRTADHALIRAKTVTLTSKGIEVDGAIVANVTDIKRL